VTRAAGRPRGIRRPAIFDNGIDSLALTASCYGVAVPTSTPVSPIAPEAAADVLAEAFRDYPVMHYVLGRAPGYDRRLRSLVRFFVAARELRGEPILGVTDSTTGSAAAAALVTLPFVESPPALAATREALWAGLGTESRARYEAYGTAAAEIRVEGVHHHLNMLGVRPAYRGQGLAGRLVTAVRELAEADPLSTGVSLSTEDPANVPLYVHLGYRVIGEVRVTGGPDVFVLFQPRR